MFPVKFDKQKESLYEMKKEKTQMVLMHISTLDCFIILPYILRLSYQNTVFSSPYGLQQQKNYPQRADQTYGTVSPYQLTPGNLHKCRTSAKPVSPT